ncbi:hypothetical protein VI06_16610 [Aquitalea magnusonii]|uniref:hypothetical protein n=1 Tax=Aquitalea TaxID=407217 RepID=UPI0005F803D0|nr:hypothetical protein [Aquitalea sp. USM4]KJV26478.1 hypothetical protein VI06_16610 [Aquitalea magnusonii]QBJ79373.1 hypothetical protein DKK66_15620 [Aquitalea sp. USM4]
MSVNSVNSSLLLNASYSSSTITDSKTGNSISSSTLTVDEVVTLGQNSEDNSALTYGKPTTGSSTPVDVPALLAKSNQQVSDFLKLLGNLVQQQGLQWNKVVSGEQKLTVDPQTKAEATQAVSEDGELGIKNTARRILDFARLGIGNDPGKIDTIRAAVQQGFDEAKKAFGGSLPDISNQTRDAIMATLDDWQKNGLPSNNDYTLIRPDLQQDQQQATQNASS